MSNLTFIEKLKLESALGMGSGYVLGFSNRTFHEFVSDSTGLDIYSEKYGFEGGSKASRLRSFWSSEPNHVVGKLLTDILEAWREIAGSEGGSEPPEELISIAHRLLESNPIADMSAITEVAEDTDFEALARSVQQSIEQNEPEAGLDRLHTFLVKYFRSLCRKHGISTEREKPLHSLVGEYVKTIKQKGLIESEMTERILKSSISVMEAFNKVRNNQSYAHDNEILNYDESYLIVAHVASSIRFIQARERLSVDKAGVMGNLFSNLENEPPF